MHVSLATTGTAAPLRDYFAHRVPLTEVPHGYDIVEHEEDRCEKAVLRP